MTHIFVAPWNQLTPTGYWSALSWLFGFFSIGFTTMTIILREFLHWIVCVRECDFHVQNVDKPNKNRFQYLALMLFTYAFFVYCFILGKFEMRCTFFSLNKPKLPINVCVLGPPLGLIMRFDFRYIIIKFSFNRLNLARRTLWTVHAYENIERKNTHTIVHIRCWYLARVRLLQLYCLSQVMFEYKIETLFGCSLPHNH